MKEIRLLVSGSRDGYDPAAFASEMFQERAHLFYRHFGIIYRESDARLVVIHGNGRGVDQQADEWGRANADEVIAVSAEWEKHKLAAGPIRNGRMISEFHPTHGLIFPGGRGTSDMMNRLFAARIPFRSVGKKF